MINYTTEEIEQNRLETIQAQASEDETGAVDTGIDLLGNQPGSFGYHEALDRASVIMGMIDLCLLEHHAILLDPEAYRLVHEAHTNLFNLYQRLGEKHL